MEPLSEASADGAAWKATRQLLESALDLAPQEREGFVRRHASSPEHAERVLALLEREHAADDDVDLGAPLKAFLDTPGKTAPPERLGPWEVRSRLGRGGMADVWLAVRADGTYRRRVAIKKLHPGLADREVVARFERERQILASLRHPGIAKMLGAGTEPDGTPYIVMELIEGQRIDEYADERHLSVRERVQLIVSVADAVMAAHRMHVVHRDIKPSNVLVDLEGRPTLLDFGVAKVLDPEKNADSMVTFDVNRYLTPNYASPEQFRGQPLRATSDVYSLGVLTYELLTGAPPLQLARVSTAEALEQSRTLEPSPPSDAFSGSPDVDELARLRGSSRAQIVRALKHRDLEAILEAALRKEPARRPPDAGAFRDELQRWLAGEPVLSRKDGPFRRARRIVARHRLVAGLSAALMLAVALGYASSWTEARRARAANEQLALQTRVAEAHLDDLRESLRLLLGDTVESLSGIPGTDHAVDRILRRGITIAERQEDPELQARLGEALIRKAEHAVRSQGPSAAAADEMERGIELVRTGLAAQGRTGNPVTAGFAMELAMLRTRLGDLQEAEGMVAAARSELASFRPASELQSIDARISSARAALTEGRVREAAGEFRALDEITGSALLDLHALEERLDEVRAADEPEGSGIAGRSAYLRSRIRAMKANLLSVRAATDGDGSKGREVAAPGETVEESAAQLLETSRALAEDHGSNRVLDANALTMRLNAARLLAQRGELETSRAIYAECAASLPELSKADPQVQELISWMAALDVRAEIAERSHDREALLAVARDATDLANVHELKLSPSFHRTRSIADLVLISGQIQARHGETSNASTQLTRAYTLYEGLAETSPTHFPVAVGRCEAALSLHGLLKGSGHDEADWLGRAHAHLEALPGDAAAHAAVGDLSQRVYAALADE
ncbi:Serine/threonine-protein kinase PrkC [Planctomycetes bacterium Poly30]|uniref:Serine/threonine-protein kinase PrkC n=1 Tax=Saltatorellus ferox TaxID=2528018 RepID=A0A518EPU9_9BACT|nr:Serine/threonine-protein kinase PrkC [Planctomycetes bacterium Poly30]